MQTVTVTQCDRKAQTEEKKSDTEETKLQVAVVAD